MLVDLATSVVAATDLETLTRPILALLNQLTGMESTYLTSIDLGRHTQKVLYSQNTSELQIPESLEVDWDDTLCKRALEEGTPYTNDVPERWGDSAAAKALGLKTYLSQPVRTLDGSLYGTICAASRSEVSLVHANLAILSLIANIIAQQVDRERILNNLREHNAQLLSQATQDLLTGALNRRALLAKLEGLLKQAERSQATVTVAFLDLDDFKKINDQYGHDIGDLFLIEVVTRLSAVLRPEDIIARYGGDEFVVAGLWANPEMLHQRLSKSLTGFYKLRECEFDYAGPSIGFAFSVFGELDPAPIIARADSAMYTVKRERKALHSNTHKLA